MSNKPLNTEPPPGSTHGSSLTRFQRLGALLLILLSLPAAVLAAPADLDPSFDGDGRVLTDFGGFDRPFEVVRQPDGKLVAAGVSFINGSEDFSLARYNPDGSLDTEFGVLGRTVTDLGGNDGCLRWSCNRTAIWSRPVSPISVAFRLLPWRVTAPMETSIRVSGMGKALSVM